MPDKLITPEATLSYPALTGPKEMPDGKLKYGACLIFPKGATGDIEAAALATAIERWGPPAKAMIAQGKLRMPLRDGAERAAVGYGPGTVFLNASSVRQPGVVSKYAGLDGKPMAVDPATAYPGCKARASLLPFAYDVNGNKGVSFLLGNIQVLDNDESRCPRLDGRLRAEDEFEALENDPGDLDATEDPFAA